MLNVANRYVLLNFEYNMWNIFSKDLDSKRKEKPLVMASNLDILTTFSALPIILLITVEIIFIRGLFTGI
jgi:hypothetical protein